VDKNVGISKKERSPKSITTPRTSI
jgi:hypothetical protein